VLTILFSYSSYPLRVAAVGGFLLSGVSFVIGAIYLVRGLVGATDVQGWTTLVVLLAVFNGFLFALLSMLGEYVVRTLNAVSAEESYHVVQRVEG
jgi:polyisoprenyl-phosphate glycosyltransferase